jgi:hypothetical protein
MKKFKIKTVLRIMDIFGKGQSGNNLVSKEGTYDVFSDLKSDVENNTFEEKNNEYSRLFFLDAMNQYEFRMNLEFHE